MAMRRTPKRQSFANGDQEQTHSSDEDVLEDVLDPVDDDADADYLISDASDEEEFGTDDIVLPGSKRAQNKRSRTKFVLRKGEIVAVRNEDNSFYLCKGETDTLLHEMYASIHWYDRNENGEFHQSYKDKVPTQSIIMRNIKLKPDKTVTSDIESKILNRLNMTPEQLNTELMDNTDSAPKRAKTEGSKTPRGTRNARDNARKTPRSDLTSPRGNLAITTTRVVQARPRTAYSQVTPLMSSQKLYNKVLSEAAQLDGQQIVRRVNLNTGRTRQISSKEAKDLRQAAVENAMSGIEQKKTTAGSPMPENCQPSKGPIIIGSVKVKRDSRSKFSTMKNIGKPVAIAAMVTKSGARIVHKRSQSNDEDPDVDLEPNPSIKVELIDPGHARIPDDLTISQNLTDLERANLFARAIRNDDVERLDQLVDNVTPEQLLHVLAMRASEGEEESAIHMAVRQDNPLILQKVLQMLGIARQFLDNKKLPHFQDLKSSRNADILRQFCLKITDQRVDDWSRSETKDNPTIDLAKSYVVKHPRNLFYQDFFDEIGKFAARYGVRGDTLRTLIDHFPEPLDTTKEGKRKPKNWFKTTVTRFIWYAMQWGQYKTAKELAVISIVECETCTLTELMVKTFSQLCDSDTTNDDFFKDWEHAMLTKFELTEIRKRDVSNMRISIPLIIAAVPGLQSRYYQALTSKLSEAATMVDSSGRRPIHYAASTNNVELLDFLLNEKKVKDTQDHQGMCALMIAAQVGSVNCVRALLNNYLKSGFTSSKDPTKGPYPVEVLSAITAIDRNNFSAIHFAAEQGHGDVIRKMWEVGQAAVKPDKPISSKLNKMSPLQLAARGGHLDACNALLECGAKLEYKCMLNRTALIYAAINGNYPVLTLFLQRGTNPNNVDIYKNTALHYTSSHSHIHCTILLLKSGAIPDQMNLLQLSPFAIAILKGNTDSAKTLIQNGADVNFSQGAGSLHGNSTLSGRTTLMSMVLALTQTSSKTNNESLFDALADRIEQILTDGELYKNVDVNLADSYGFTVLHYISRSNNSSRTVLRVLKMLLDHGADPNTLDKNDANPIWYALKNKNVEQLDILSSKSKLIPKTDLQGNNMLHLIVQMVNFTDPKLFTQIECWIRQICNNQNNEQAKQSIGIHMNTEKLTPLLLFAKDMVDIHTGAITLEGTDISQIFYNETTEDRASWRMFLDRAKNKSMFCDKDVGKLSRILRALMIYGQCNIDDSFEHNQQNLLHCLAKMTFLKKEFLRNMLNVCKECDVVKYAELDRFGLTALNMAIVYRNTSFIEILVQEENVTMDLQKSGATLRLRYELDPILLLVMKHLSSPFQGRLIGGQTSRAAGDLTQVMDLCLSKKQLKNVAPCSITGKTPLMAAAEANVAADMLSTLLANSDGLKVADKVTEVEETKIIIKNEEVLQSVIEKVDAVVSDNAIEDPKTSEVEIAMDPVKNLVSEVSSVKNEKISEQPVADKIVTDTDDKLADISIEVPFPSAESAIAQLDGTSVVKPAKFVAENSDNVETSVGKANDSVEIPLATLTEKTIEQVQNTERKPVSVENPVAAPKTNLKPISKTVKTSNSDETALSELISVQDSCGRTALHLAVSMVSVREKEEIEPMLSDITECVELLLGQSDIKVGKRDSRGRTPLHYAFSERNNDPLNLVCLLLDKMTTEDVRTVDQQGRTALHIASLQGATKCIQLLLQNEDVSRDLELKDKSGASVLALAVQNHNFDTASMLIMMGCNANVMIPKKSIDLNALSNTGGIRLIGRGRRTISYWNQPDQAQTTASSSRHLISVLFEEKNRNLLVAIVNKRRDELELQKKIIEISLEQRQFECTLWLVRRFIYISSDTLLTDIDDQGRILVHSIAAAIPDSKNDHLMMCKLLSVLHEKTVLEQASYNGLTVVHFAVANRSMPMIQRLYGLLGKEKFSKIVKGNMPSVLAALVWEGCNTNLTISEESNCTDIVEFLFNLVEDKSIFETNLPIPAWFGHVDESGRVPDFTAFNDQLESKISCRLDSMCANTEIRIPIIHLFIRANMNRVLDLLIEGGMDVNSIHSSTGNLTPLMTAVKSNNQAAVEKLIEMGAMVHAQDTEQRSALHHAVWPLCWGMWKNVNCVESLLKAGVEPLQEDLFGRSVVDYVLEKGSLDVAYFLQEKIKGVVSERMVPSQVFQEFTEQCTWPVPDFISDSQVLYENEMNTDKVAPMPKVDNVARMTGQVMEDNNTKSFADVVLSSIELCSDGVPLNKLDGVQISIESIKPHQIVRRLQVVEKRVPIPERTKILANGGTIQGSSSTSVYTVLQRTVQDHNKPSKEDRIELSDYASSQIGQQASKQALTLFVSKFKQMTANDWSYLVDNRFKRVSKKFTVIPKNLVNQHYGFGEKIRLQLNNKSESVIPQLHSLMLDMFNIQAIEDLLPSLTGLDMDELHFTRLNEANLLKALTILEKLLDTLSAIEHVNNSENFDINHIHWLYEEVISHVLDVRTLIPFKQVTGVDDMLRATSIVDFGVEHAEKLSSGIKDIVKVKTITEVILGAMQQRQRWHWLDYCYRSLDTNIEMLEKESAETKAILSHIPDSAKVIGIYRCQRSNEASQFAQCPVASHGNKNNNMLWRGAGPIEVVDALVHGPVRLFSVESETKNSEQKFARTNGSKFYQLFDDAADNTIYSDKCKKLMFYTQVVLGKSKLCNLSNAKLDPEDNYDSLHILGEKYYQQDVETLVTPEGGEIPMGCLENRSVPEDILKFTPKADQFIVYEPDQVVIRYIVRFE